MRRRLLAAVALLFLQTAAVAENVVTYHNSNHRHGAYTIPTLTLAAAGNMRRDAGFAPVLDGHVYAQPLFWQPKGVKTGLVIVATESNHVYALAADTGAVAWQRFLGAAEPHSEMACGNIDPVGVTGTPVIDSASGVLYLDAMRKTASGPRHLVYALLLADGSVLPHWPLDVQRSLTKMGATFSSLVQGERSALLFFGNKLYVNYAGNFGDCGDYRGTVVQIAPATPRIEADWQTRARGGGIWAQGGIAGDGRFLYVTTGNTFGATTWSDGESVIRLLPGLAHSGSTRDYFTPSNWQDLDSADKDLGGTEALPFNVPISGSPPAARVIAFGKDGNAYLLDRANLGGIGGALAVTPVANGPIRTAPAIYQTDAGALIALTNAGSAHCSGSNVTALKVAAGGASPVSFSWCQHLNGGGAPIVTTTDGKENPIVWVVGAEGDNLLHGFDALTGQAVFAGAGTAMSGLHHFQTILATRERFYVAADGTVYAFRWQ